MTDNNDKIQELNVEQEEVRKHFRDMYFRLGWRSGAADRQTAETAIAGIYETLGHKVPEFVWFDSPFAAVDTIRESTGERTGLSSVDGAIDAYWTCYYRFGLWLVNNHRDQMPMPELVDDPVEFSKQLDELLGASNGVYDDKDAQLLRKFDALVRSCGPCWPYENYCLMSELPVSATYDGNELLHNDTGPALLYRDGEAVYAVNGIRLPHRIGKLAIETPWLMTFEQVQDPEWNEDVRTILQERWCDEEVDSAGDRVGAGGGRWLKAIGATELEFDTYRAYTGEDGEEVQCHRALIAAPDEQTTDEEGESVTRRGMRYLMCCDSSTDRVYYIPCGREVNTCEEAHQLLNGGIPTSQIVASS